MEKMDYDMQRFLSSFRYRKYSLKNKVSMCLSIAQGLEYVHVKQNIIHRDLKPENILIKVDEETGEHLFKIADFGLSRQFLDFSERD